MTTNFNEKADKTSYDTVNAVTSEKNESILDGKMYTEMINAGAANLKAHAQAFFTGRVILSQNVQQVNNYFAKK